MFGLTVEPVPRATAAFSPAVELTGNSDPSRAARDSHLVQGREKGLFLPLKSGLSLFTTHFPLNFYSSLLMSCNLGRVPPGAR